MIRAFDSLEGFPALLESRNRLLGPAGGYGGGIDEVVAAVESDVALVVAVMRLANQLPTRVSKVETIADAVLRLGPAAVQRLAEGVSTFDFFDSTVEWGSTPERFRVHALATRSAADLLADKIHYAYRDRLIVAALLHDVGKIVLLAAYPGYADSIHPESQAPEERIARERRELGVDHALVGGVLARRWGLPKSIATAIDRHHSDEGSRESQLLRLADILAHYAHGDALSPAEMLRVAAAAGVGSAELRSVLFALPQISPAHKQRVVEPCPLSARECDVLRQLATGDSYKQIASNLSLSTSTVRTHLHHIYGTLEVVDRAQAVLIATERGWLQRSAGVPIV